MWVVMFNQDREAHEDEEVVVLDGAGRVAVPHVPDDALPRTHGHVRAC